MGRPKKQTVDYFPHFVEGARRTLFVLEEEWRNDGYAFWFKLLELLCKSDGHYFDISSSADQKYLCAFAKVPQDTAIEILNTLAELGNIDPDLWGKRKIIWCQSLVDNLKGLYDKRTTEIPTKPVFEETKPENETKNTENGISGTETPPEPAEPQKPRRKKAAKPKEEEPPKITYADNVTMTEQEHGKLVAKYGEANTQKLIDKLDNAKGAKGYKYKSDYRAILNWVVEEVLGKNGGANDHGRNEAPTGNNGTTANGGFRPSTGFKTGS